MDNYNLEDFENVLCLKNQLVNVPLDKLMEVYQDYDNYLCFLDTIAVMSDIDSSFLLFSPYFIEVIQSIIQIHRFDVEDSNVKEAINSIIGYLNQLKSYSDSYRDFLKNGYLDYHEDVRKVEFSSDRDFLFSLGYDAVVYVALHDGNMDLISDDTLFLSSLNYFIETIPDVFKDSLFLNRAIDYLNKIDDKKFPLFDRTKKYCKETRNNFQKIK